ncbi:MAG TPA: Na+/H+ antiporter NhaC family protein [Candidatus Anaerotruncus excrementipullorum]|uniref:Na+/H+ antiporter NhaC family protein n=1 Tax=Candidatus Anaerotruncus excrementipullorum TaxID=2838465 RepID=A0A9D1WSV3_9FIRM|nr:Na+/H+ antiporter NhaC family protein [Candidatus Anaerotruncus excrementipullorum]
MATTNQKVNGWALVPFVVMLVLFFCGFPIVTATLTAAATSFFFGKGKVSEKFTVFARGSGDEGVLIMLMIFALSGAFSSVATAMGGRDAVVNLGLSLVPVHFLAAGCFVIAMVMSTACGTSMGTIAAITPIAVGVGQKGGLDMLVLLGAVVGGAMFGDNLSMISDTTIAACRGQGVEMKDKFRLNFLIALPAAILTIVLLCIFGRPEVIVPIGELSYTLIKVIPYLVVLVLALVGMDVMLVMALGIVMAGIVGLVSGDITIIAFAEAIWTGITDMDQSFYLAFLIAGMAEIVKEQGGIEWLVVNMRKIMKSNKSAQLSIAALVGLADAAITNNTVAIIIANPVAKDVSRQYNIDPRRTASLLDLFSCVVQGIIPHGGQTLLACTLAASYGIVATPMEIIPYLWYCMLLGVFGILSIFIPYADGAARRDPWNWEYDCAQSKVAEKKAAMESAAAQG